MDLLSFVLLLFSASSVYSEITAKVTYFNLTDCLAFIALKIDIVKNHSSDVIHLPDTKSLNLASSSCGERKTVISFSYSNIEEMSSMSISISFAKQSQRWIVESSTVIIACTAGSKICVNVPNGHLDLSWLTAPSNTGFKCTTPPLAAILSSGGVKTGLSLKFTWLQVQPFGAKGGKFGEAADCVRYFTIPIWSTLLVSFLLLGVLTYGLQMLAAIRPNDLYDDPKQKMVQLGASN